MAPGNAGMSEAIVHAQVNPNNPEAVINLCKQISIDLVIVGPEAYLERGIADHLTAHGISVFGPSQMGARLESSKVFAKEFMLRNKIPTARASIVRSKTETLEAAKQFNSPYVLKVDGLASGKGVFICSSLNELQDRAQEVFENKTLGSAGAQALVEDKLDGYEISFLVLTNGKDFEPLPLAQDHKRLKDGNAGPNTGGMGAICPINLPSSDYNKIIESVIRPTMAALYKERINFNGVLYFGIMMTDQGPKVLEFNARFGDPEAQVILPLLEGEWVDVFMEVAKGQIPKLKWRQLHSCCIVMASPGYPDSPNKGVVMRGNLFEDTPSSYFLHAATALAENAWTTNGGRVLNAVGLGSSLKEAVSHAYKQVEKVRWEGMQFRKDIGNQFLS